MLNRLSLCIAGIVIGLSLGIWIATPKESDAVRLIRMKAEVQALHDMFQGDHWNVDRKDWDIYRKDVVGIAIIENRLQLERTNSNGK